MRSPRLSIVASVAALGALLAGPASAAPTVSVFAAASGVVDPSGSTVSAPDSISFFNGSFWVVYTNGASKTCGGGDSTIVQYDTDGNVLQTFSVPNYVDGLRGNPADGKIWALQCEDGNSTLTIIDPVAHALSAAISYKVPSSSQGYDDAVFSGSAATHDGVFATSKSGTFYVSDTSNNQILAIHATGLIPGSLFASVGGMNTFAQVDLGTGQLTPLVPMNVPHGATFVADPPGNVIEFFNASLGNYFYTTSLAEISALDKGGAWVRTGQSFKAFAQNTSGTYPVCRFLIQANAHFFTASPDECLAILNDPAFSSFVLESPNAFYIYLPDVVSGACPTGTISVYRLWDAKANEDHRYTTSLAIKAQMLAIGYVSEGYGPNGVAMCAIQ
jgi:hypothetical protein